jgi:hypothetical protein
MPQCALCGENLARSHRKFWEKPIYSVVFKCKGCETRVGAKHNFFNYLASHARCPRCGTEDLGKRITRDKIDKVIRTPISILQSIVGGTLYHCIYCRIQFYDLRGRRRIRKQSEAERGTVSPVG